VNPSEKLILDQMTTAFLDFTPCVKVHFDILKKYTASPLQVDATAIGRKEWFSYIVAN
jgi:hypothetical protein